MVQLIAPPAGNSRASGITTNGGQVVGLAAQAVAQPGAQRGEPVEPEAAVLLERRRGVVRGLGDHRADHRQLVGHLGEVREEVGDPEAALARAGGTPSRACGAGRPGRRRRRAARTSRATGRARRSGPACSRTSRPGSSPRTRQMWMARVAFGAKCGQGGLASPGTRRPGACRRGASAPAAAAPARPLPHPGEELAAVASAASRRSAGQST